MSVIKNIIKEVYSILSNKSNVKIETYNFRGVPEVSAISPTAMLTTFPVMANYFKVFSVFILPHGQSTLTSRIDPSFNREPLPCLGNKTGVGSHQNLGFCRLFKRNVQNRLVGQRDYNPVQIPYKGEGTGVKL